MAFHIVQQLANHGAAKVYMAARSESAATAAISQIEAENPALNEKGSVVFLHLDRSTIAGAQSAAEKFLQLESKADILVDEVNDTLASAQSTNSLFGRYARYARSKLANIIFAKGLQKEFDSSSSSALPIAVNPGGVATGTVMGNMGLRINAIFMRKRELGTGGSPSANTRSRRAVQKKERSPVVLNPCPRHEAKHSAPGIQCLSNDDISDAKALRSRVHLGDGGGPHLNSSSSEDEEMVSPRKPRKMLNITSESDDNTPRKRLHRRDDPDSEDSSSEMPVTPRKRRKTLNVATSDSDDHTPRKRIRRRESNVDDSDTDVDDLELSPPPSPSKPTAKERKRVTMDETKVEETSDSDELAWGSDTSSSDSDTGSEGQSSENMGSFIVDDSEKTEDPDADDIESARGPEYYARRRLSEQFMSFVEYLVRFYLNPDLLSTVSDNDRWSYQAAIKAMRIRTEAVPFLLALTLASPWIARPAGRGTYNRDNFDDESESDDDYGEETTWDFNNSAHADKLRYPPGFRLVVGARATHADA
ncbi:hypothetical protein B0H14DRAFT_3528127 [Mycena olivaceomarginata]|nr:hypothetical protein B0H14DRAFT_3528127 [Mycena olivaceomarginata]